VSSAPHLSDLAEPRLAPDSVALSGPPVSPQGRISLYSADEWEEFVCEWAHELEKSYVQIKRFGGAGDRGADVAAFESDRGLEGPWDCFQCKHYNRPINFSDAAPEILKVFLGVLDGEYVLPNSYQILAPQGCSTNFGKLLSQPTRLGEQFSEALSTSDALVRRLTAERVQQVRQLAGTTDFGMFKSVELTEALDVHSRSRWHAARFGTALRPRPPHEPPPAVTAPHESRYVEQLVEVYREKHPSESLDPDTVATNEVVGEHFRRQRERFYKAESLRVYARDAVPAGTFEKLQEDIYAGVIDTAELDHPTGYQRLAQVLGLVGQLDLSRHTLITVAEIDDRQGICHQLANVDRLIWVRPT
jgi:hypothetical protein